MVSGSEASRTRSALEFVTEASERVEQVAIVWEPCSFASWTAKFPTLPDAPCFVSECSRRDQEETTYPDQ